MLTKATRWSGSGVLDLDPKEFVGPVLEGVASNAPALLKILQGDVWLNDVCLSWCPWLENNISLSAVSLSPLSVSVPDRY